MYSICRPWPIMLKMGRAPIYVWTYLVSSPLLRLAWPTSLLLSF